MTHRTPTGRQIRLVIAVSLGLGCAFDGFYSSFRNLTTYAAKHHFPYPPGLALGLDLGIVALLMLESLYPSAWLRWAAWSFTAGTVAANAAVTPGGGYVSPALHAVMPGIAVIFFEAFRRLRGRDERQRRREERRRARRARRAAMDRIPWPRYIVAPVRTPKLRARMISWNVTSYTEALRLESAILTARTVLCTEYGERSWRQTRKQVPIILRHDLKTGQLPAELFYGTDLREPVRAWIRDSLDDLDPHRAPEPAETAPAEPVPEPVPTVVVERDPWDRVWDRLDRTVPDGLTSDQIVIAYGLARRYHEQVGRHIVADKLRGPVGIGKPKALALAAAMKTAYETELDPRYSARFPAPAEEGATPATGETAPDHSALPGLHAAPERAPADA